MAAYEQFYTRVCYKKKHVKNPRKLATLARYVICDEYGIHVYKNTKPAHRELSRIRDFKHSHTIDYYNISSVELFSDSDENYSVLRIKSDNTLYHTITFYFMGNNYMTRRQYIVDAVKDAFEQIYSNGSKEVESSEEETLKTHFGDA